MDISTEQAWEKLQRWSEDSSELVLLFKVFGMNGVIAAKIEALQNDCISLSIKPDAPPFGLIRIWLTDASFRDEPAKPGDDTLTVKFSQGECKLQRRTINDWPEFITDERPDVIADEAML